MKSVGDRCGKSAPPHHGGAILKEESSQKRCGPGNRHERYSTKSRSRGRAGPASADKTRIRAALGHATPWTVAAGWHSDGLGWSNDEIFTPARSIPWFLAERRCRGHRRDEKAGISKAACHAPLRSASDPESDGFYDAPDGWCSDRKQPGPKWTAQAPALGVPSGVQRIDTLRRRITPRRTPI